MITTVNPGTRSGIVNIPSSKSQMHRLLICAALGSNPVTIRFDGISNDISATAKCMNALGADIKQLSENELFVKPVEKVPSGLCHLFCGESGSTLRFLLPVVGMLGADAVFHMEGRLPQRPLAPLDALLGSHGMSLKQENDLLYVSGKLCSGSFSIPGNISSQYVSGLLMSLPFVDGDSIVEVTGKVESKAYITMTEDVLKMSGIKFENNNFTYTVKGGQKAVFPEHCDAEGDYSNAAFFLSIGALSKEGVFVYGLNPESSQGDKAVLDILRSFGAIIENREKCIFIKRGDLKGIVIDAAPIPDLIPVLSVVASTAKGTTEVINAGRLRLKESDRLESTAALLRTLGADITVLDEGLIINGVEKLGGGEISSFGDHRIAMSAAVASCASDGIITVNGSECTAKSYPRFWEDFAKLKGED